MGTMGTLRVTITYMYFNLKFHNCQGLISFLPVTVWAI